MHKAFSGKIVTTHMKNCKYYVYQNATVDVVLTRCFHSDIVIRIDTDILLL